MPGLVRELLSVSALNADGGGEICAHYFKRFLEQNGIVHLVTMPYVHEQNGIIERLNRSLLVMTGSMLHMHNHDKVYWAEAVKTANYLRNLIPNETTKLTPYELFYKKSPAPLYPLLKVWAVWRMCVFQKKKGRNYQLKVNQ